jgi:mono/diheme cytochrome c family protein
VQCLACHGVDGTGAAFRAAFPSIPDLTNATWQQTRTDDNFSTRIRDGKPPTMPAFADKLNADQIHALVLYTRAFTTATPASK